MYAKKSLGQNFLKSKPALKAMRDASDVNALDVVLEIGPGKGALTETLLPFVGKLIAVEKDEALVKLLAERFKKEIDEKKLEILSGDILEFDPEMLRPYVSDRFDYKLVANIPYYITGAVIRKFLTSSLQPAAMVLLLQKEVAKRIVASDKKESLLSLSVKAYGKPIYIDTVKAKYFSPIPKVDSGILAINDISRNFFNGASEEGFFELLKAGFAHKRKQLAGNLKTYFKDLSAESIEKAFSASDIDIHARAEDIPLEKWKRLLLAMKI